MAKKIEIELPEITKEQELKLKRTKFDLVKGVGDTGGLTIYQFVIAKLIGYTVKKEPKYYIHFVENDPFSYLNFSRHDKKIELDTKVSNGYYQTQFTEAEVNKLLDWRYWAFKELVEDE